MHSNAQMEARQERSNTDVKAVVHGHMPGQRTVQYGAGLHQTPLGLEKRSGTELGK